MNLLIEANNLCRRLWRDQSGVVLALTVVVYLTLFIIGCSVYAVGENIRQRIELQNAADAAAYSAAVVQADALSRIAALNKAMAWTYVSMGVEEMNYILDVWTLMTVERWDSRTGDLDNWIRGFKCTQQWVGLSGSHGTIRLHQSRQVGINQLRGATWQAINARAGKIDDYRKTIKGMLKAQTDVLYDPQYGLGQRIKNVVIRILTDNCGSASVEKYSYALSSESPSSYFTTLTEETRFLQFFDLPSKTDAKSLFGNGVDVPEQGEDGWFVTQQRNDGIQRTYQQKRYLQADWSWYAERWQLCTDPYTGRRYCCKRETQKGTEGIMGQDGRSGRERYYETEVAKPQVLTSDYFGEKGAIVVGVARRMTNPLSFMTTGTTELGIFDFFTPSLSGDGKDRYSWAVAAARAGYFDGDPKSPQPAAEAGKYNPTLYREGIESPRNLSQTDWDAVLIPLNTITIENKATLRYLWENARWQALFSGGTGGNGLGSFASGTVPTGPVLH